MCIVVIMQITQANSIEQRFIGLAGHSYHVVSDGITDTLFVDSGEVIEVYPPDAEGAQAIIVDGEWIATARPSLGSMVKAERNDSAESATGWNAFEAAINLIA